MTVIAKLSRHARPRCDGSLVKALRRFDALRGLCGVCHRPYLTYSSSVHGPDLVTAHDARTPDALWTEARP